MSASSASFICSMKKRRGLRAQLMPEEHIQQGSTPKASKTEARVRVDMLATFSLEPLHKTSGQALSKTSSARGISQSSDDLSPDKPWRPALALLRSWQGKPPDRKTCLTRR